MMIDTRYRKNNGHHHTIVNDHCPRTIINRDKPGDHTIVISIQAKGSSKTSIVIKHINESDTDYIVTLYITTSGLQ